MRASKTVSSSANKEASPFGGAFLLKKTMTISRSVVQILNRRFTDKSIVKELPTI